MTNMSQKWPSNLVIVRHAESDRNVWKEIATAKGELVYGGKVRDMDVELTDSGKKQATATGLHLGAEFNFDRVFASPFIRTMQTAQIMAAQFPYQVDITEDERLREIDFGIFDGLTKQGIAHHYPDEHNRRARLSKYWHRPIAGENWPDVALRVHSFLDTLTREAAGESVLVISHSVVVLIFRKLLERMTEQEIRKIDKDAELENCSVTQYQFDRGVGRYGKLILRDYNRLYYPDELRMKAIGQAAQ
jgi:broad specificity phosphatase PhoE